MMAQWFKYVGFVLTSAVLCTAPGCDTKDGDTEGESESASESDTSNDSETGDVQGSCGAETKTVISDLNASLTDFMSTPSEYYAALEGTKSGTFTWAEIGEFVTTPYGSTSSPLTVTIAAGSEVRLIEVENHGDFPNGQEGGAPCSNRLELDVTLGFLTEDGVFAINQPATIKIEAFTFDGPEGSPYLYHSIDLDNHAGMLAAGDFTVSEGMFAAAILTGTWSDATLEGGLLVEVDGGEWIGAGNLGSFSAM